MATRLTHTAYYARKSINYTVLGIIGFIFLWILSGLLVQALAYLFPVKPPPPNHAFGLLPRLKFPPSLPADKQYPFTLETIQGGIPTASSSAVVYYMPKNAATLLALTRAQQFAERLDFSPDPVQESRSTYRFDDPQSPLRKLRYDIVANNFTIRYGYEEDTVLFSDKETLNIKNIQSEADSFFSSNHIMPADFTGGVKSTSYLKLVGNTLQPASSISQADAVRLDFFRQPLAGYPVYTAFPQEAPIFAIYSLNKDPKKHLLTLSYTYWPIDYQTLATYPLKTTAVAWDELQKGKGYIAQYPSKGDKIVVRGVKLGYYDAYDPQTYMQPIFIFEGDYGFLGYVHAIDSTWVQPEK